MTPTLSKIMARAKAAKAAGSKFVTSFSLEPDVAIAAVIVADAENRDFSNLAEVALDEYAGSRRPPEPKVSEVLGKITVAAARRPQVVSEIEAVLARSARKLRQRKHAA